MRAIYRVNFADDLDIGDSSVVANCLSQLSIDPNPIIATANSAESKLLLRTQNAMAAQLNIFGAPSFFADGELFWGNDRLEQAFQWFTTGKNLG